MQLMDPFGSYNSHLLHIFLFIQAVVALAKKHQTGDNPQPLSLITMWTPTQQRVTEEEMRIRQRVAGLSPTS